MYYLCKATWPHLQPGKTFITTASIQTYHPSPQLLANASTKGAVISFSKALPQEGAKTGIRVNFVAPGPVWAPLILAITSGRRSKLTDNDRPSEPVSYADGTAAWTHTSPPCSNAIWYQMRYPLALVPMAYSSPASTASRRQ